MRRVFAVIGFSSFFITLFCIYFGVNFDKIVIAVGLILFLGFLIFGKTRKLIILLLLFLITVCSAFHCMFFDLRIEEYDSIYNKDEVELSGELLDYPTEYHNGFDYTFRSLDENKIKFSVFSYDWLDIEPGDKIIGKFDFGKKFADYSEKIYFSAYLYDAGSVKIVKGDDKFNIAKFRKLLKSGIDENMTYGRGLAKAIVFGDKSGITEDLYFNLKKCGLLHATATSGLHLTIVTGFLFSLLSFLGFSKKKSSVIGIVFVLLFMIVIGFKFSLMRAGIMMIMVLASNLFDREGDAFNAIGLSITIMIALNPYSAVSCSFLLSLSATMGMILIFVPMSKCIQNIKFKKFNLLKKISASFLAGMAQSCAATVFTLPIVYIFYGYFSIVGIFINAILAPFISLVLIFGVLISILSFIPILPQILGGNNDIFALVIIKISEFIGKFKYCLININYEFIAVFFAACAVIIAVSIFLYYFYKFEKRKLIRVSAILCFNIFLASAIIFYFIPEKSINIRVQNSGGGINITAVIDGKSVVIDTGGKYCERKTDNVFTGKEVNEISYLIIPKTSSDSYSAAQTISNSIKTNNMILNRDMLDNKLYKMNGKQYNINSISSLTVSGLKITFINQQDFTALYLANEQCSALLIDKLTDCASIPKQYKFCDLLIVNDCLPDDIDEIYADKALIFTYENDNEQKCAEKFTSYSLRNSSVDLVIKDEIKIREV